MTFQVTFKTPDALENAAMEFGEIMTQREELA